MHQNHIKIRNGKLVYIISTPDGESKGEAISKYNTSEIVGNMSPQERTVGLGIGKYKYISRPIM